MNNKTIFYLQFLHIDITVSTLYSYIQYISFRFFHGHKKSAQREESDCFLPESIRNRLGESVA